MVIWGTKQRVTESAHAIIGVVVRSSSSSGCLLGSRSGYRKVGLRGEEDADADADEEEGLGAGGRGDL